MKKFLIGLLIAGSAVVLGTVVSKLLKKNSDTDFDDDDFDYDYPEEFGEDEENIAIDDTDLEDEIDPDFLIDDETDVPAPAEETEEEE